MDARASVSLIMCFLGYYIIRVGANILNNNCTLLPAFLIGVGGMWVRGIDVYLCDA